VARVVAVFDDLLLGSNVLGMLRAAGHDATLAGGGDVIIRVGVLPDPYIPKQELETVSVELERDGEHLAAVATVLSPDQDSEALALAREIKRGLESGALEPTAGAIEPLADRIPAV
jgi:hypothetical protein